MALRLMSRSDPAAMIHYTFLARTDPGRARDNNEDAVLVDEPAQLGVLADGMGGYNAGEIASGMATAFIKSEMARWLAESPIKSDYVFTAFEGRGERLAERPLSASAIWRIVRKYSDSAGLEDIKPHDFRRFVGTQLARNNLRMAQKALGHKRLETTARHYILDELEAGLTDDLY